MLNMSKYVFNLYLFSSFKVAMAVKISICQILLECDNSYVNAFFNHSSHWAKLNLTMSFLKDLLIVLAFFLSFEKLRF